MPRGNKLPKSYTHKDGTTYDVVEISDSKGALRLGGLEYGMLSVSSRDTDPVVCFYKKPKPVAEDTAV